MIERTIGYRNWESCINAGLNYTKLEGEVFTCDNDVVIEDYTKRGGKKKNIWYLGNFIEIANGSSIHLVGVQLDTMCGVCQFYKRKRTDIRGDD